MAKTNEMANYLYIMLSQPINMSQPWAMIQHEYIMFAGYRMPPPDSMPPSVAEVMALCWEAEPTDRPKFDKIFKDLQSLHKTS